MSTPDSDRSLLARIVASFLRPVPASLAIAFAAIVGVVALWATPREEEPQIVVPLADVFVEAPGLSAGQVERHVATRVEKLLAQIDGVEHVYSVSEPGRAVVTVRFYVGEDREESLLEIQTKLHANVDRIPASVTGWVVKPVEIDDVPIWIATLWSDAPGVDDYTLRRVAEELEIALKEVSGTNATSVVGGRPRVVAVLLDPEALAARRTAPLDVAWALSVSNTRATTRGFDRADQHVVVEAGARFESAEALRDAVVHVVDATPVHLRDVARVTDGPDERRDATWLAFGAADPRGRETGEAFAAVHLAVAKQRGTNAVTVARALDERLAALAPSLLPDGVHVRVIRDYGETANDKVNELLRSLLEAMIIVVALLLLTLGWRESLVVALAVPLTFGLTLAINWALGFTINRVTLFALILALGLVVDDPIVDVENIHRHVRLKGRLSRRVVLDAVNEVRPPILLATATVMVSFLPMLFITGMMGPYMRPMAVNVPVAMAVSMAIAFCVTPYLSWRLLRAEPAHRASGDAEDEAAARARRTARDPVRRLYARALGPLLDDRRRGTVFLWGLGALFVASLALGAARAVPLKMLPFDNKSELQVVLDMPETATLERTDAVARALAAVLQRAPEVEEIAGFVGTASPMDFNGLVRHSFLRSGPNVADLRIGLVPKGERSEGSHAFALRVRPALEAVARAEGARIAIVEVPPGPPVLSTITAEVYGDPGVPYEALRDGALRVAARLAREPAVSDVDTTVEHAADRLVLETNRTKAALSGVSADDVARTVALALDGLDVGEIHRAGEANPLPIRLRVARPRRSGSEGLASLPLQGRPGVAKEAAPEGGLRAAPAPTVRIGELGTLRERPRERAIYRKDLRRVAFVYAEPVGRPPAEVVADVAADLDAELAAPAATRPAGGGSSVDRLEVAAAPSPRPLAGRTYFANGGGIPWSLPEGVFVDWLGEGELAITRDVFRDLGAAFGVALLGIYGLLVYQTGSAAMPLVLMISIPLTLLGIMPGFWLLGLFRPDVAGSANPVFFTATAMIGVIALAGIAVRNAILLIEFLHRALERGQAFREALLEAGAVRVRPIALTAGSALLAAIPITFDPIFAGLAWALIFGLLVSTLFTLLVVPLVYDRVYRDRPGHGLPVRVAEEEDDG
ncbi:MAG: efflux RND transporter permease subunit [Myxococcota bacterium]